MNFILLLGLALVLSGGLSGCKTAGACHSHGSGPSGAVSDGLQMALSISRAGNRGDPEFEVTIRNVGEEDVSLNLGSMLANGKTQLPGKIHLQLKDGTGQTRELDFSDRRHPGVAGRVDDYVVPLRSGSSYTLKLRLDQFWSPGTREFDLKLKPGRYRVSARFQGGGAETSNEDMAAMKRMNFWIGTLQSNTADLTE